MFKDVLESMSHDFLREQFLLYRKDEDQHLAFAALVVLGSERLARFMGAVITVHDENVDDVSSGFTLGLTLVLEKQESKSFRIEKVLALATHDAVEHQVSQFKKDHLGYVEPVLELVSDTDSGLKRFSVIVREYYGVVFANAFLASLEFIRRLELTTAKHIAGSVAVN